MKEKIIELLRELSGNETINENDALQSDLALDSLSMVTLLVELEETFGFQLDESDMNPFDLLLVSDVMKLVSKYAEGTDEK